MKNNKEFNLSDTLDTIVGVGVLIYLAIALWNKYLEGDFAKYGFDPHAKPKVEETCHD